MEGLTERLTAFDWTKYAGYWKRLQMRGAFYFPQRARAAFRALSRRCALVIFFARAAPPAAATFLRFSGVTPTQRAVPPFFPPFFPPTFPIRDITREISARLGVSLSAICLV
jgi:hypothetical protein